MVKIGIRILIVLLIFLPIVQQALANSDTVIPNHNVTIKNLGKIVLAYQSDQGADTTQLILEKPGGLRTIIKTYEGLIPDGLFKADLDLDSFPEFIVVLKYSEDSEKVPIIYGTKTNILQIYPEPNQDTNDLVCRKTFLTNYNKQNVLCTKNLIKIHDFGPPNLYHFRYFLIKDSKLTQISDSFSKDGSYNIVMNKGGFAFQKGQYFQAIKYYEQATASLTEKLNHEAYTEALYYQAQASKYVKNFKNALKIFQRIVIEFRENAWTNNAQREIEIISSNLNNQKALSLWIDISNQILRENWLNASDMFEQIRIPEASPSLQARLLFMSAEVSVALNNIDKAISIYHSIIEKFPDLPIVDSVNRSLQDLEVNPEETDGL